jgi:hypothetical protein
MKLLVLVCQYHRVPTPRNRWASALPVLMLQRFDALTQSLDFVLQQLPLLPQELVFVQQSCRRRTLSSESSWQIRRWMLPFLKKHYGQIIEMRKIKNLLDLSGIAA